jgi:hypothetical protein
MRMVVADHGALHRLWLPIASAGAWSYVETKRTKAIEQGGGLEPRPSDCDTLHFVDFDGSGKLLEVHCAERLDLEPVSGQPPPDRPDDDLVGVDRSLEKP